MGIDRIGPSGRIQPSDAQGARTPRSAANAERADLDVRDRIELSPAGRELAAAPPDEREQKVQHLREQVLDGTYRADADAIAERLVDLGDV